MGMKYIINAFDYPYQGIEVERQTKWFIVAISFFCLFSFKYDGVDLQKRG